MWPIPKEIQRQVFARSRGRCEGQVDDGRMKYSERCTKRGDDWSLYVAYGYDEEHVGPMKASYVKLLCEECYEQTEGGQREAYDRWLAERD
jgi:hypothetical protein